MENGEWMYTHTSGNAYKVAFRCERGFVAYRVQNGSVRIHVRPAAGTSLPSDVPAPFVNKSDALGDYASASVTKVDARVVVHRAVDWFMAACGHVALTLVVT